MARTKIESLTPALQQMVKLLMRGGGTPAQLADKLQCSKAGIYARLKVLREKHGFSFVEERVDDSGVRGPKPTSYSLAK